MRDLFLRGVPDLLKVKNNEGITTFLDDSPSFWNHSKPRRHLQETQKRYHASKRIIWHINERKLNSRTRRQTQLNACTQMSNAEFSWPFANSIVLSDEFGGFLLSQEQSVLLGGGYYARWRMIFRMGGNSKSNVGGKGDVGKGTHAWRRSPFNLSVLLALSSYLREIQKSDRIPSSKKTARQAVPISRHRARERIQGDAFHHTLESGQGTAHCDNDANVLNGAIGTMVVTSNTLATVLDHSGTRPRTVTAGVLRRWDKTDI
ncbi:hypothetical protein EDD85DRAFT_785193 [Armillaria nabsnona]|nr:hypothetical protein EDD85DRAFT_785193 [Armillaria nabsnona]